MGVLSELIIGDQKKAERIAKMGMPSKVFEGIDIKGIDTIKLANLNAILSQKTYEDFEFMHDPIGSTEGTWVFLIPPDLVATLASLKSESIAGIALEWGKTEEFRLEKWPEPLIEQTLSEICDLASKALAAKRDVLLWMSL